AYGTLQLHRLNLNLGHGICGPWGCGPETKVLLANHGFWTVLLLPPLLVIGRRLSRLRRIQFALTLLATGLCGVIAYVAWDLTRFFEADLYTQYWPQRIWFALATQVDLPMMQLTAAGLMVLCLCYRPATSASNEHSSGLQQADSSRPSQVET
ncbi:MAG: hypothetical protein MI861_16095, partial [Pirellulales bacterium]|nr:hypothetical protein [Pirellulales bacterium]